MVAVNELPLINVSFTGYQSSESASLISRLYPSIFEPPSSDGGFHCKVISSAVCDNNCKPVGVLGFSIYVIKIII